jgi:membrane protease YdiL (CAAX protease family)
LVKAWGQKGADAGIAELARLPVWFRVVLGVTGGVVEETLYRGYAVERLATLTGRRWLGATLATIAFAAAHIPAWGVGFALVADLPAGVILVLFYLWRRDLVANMLAHSAGLIMAMFTIVPGAV